MCANLSECSSQIRVLFSLQQHTTLKNVSDLSIKLKFVGCRIRSSFRRSRDCRRRHSVGGSRDEGRQSRSFDRHDGKLASWNYRSPGRILFPGWCQVRFTYVILSLFLPPGNLSLCAHYYIDPQINKITYFPC